MLHRPIGTDTTFGELFGGLVSLERALAVPDYLQEEQTVEERFLQLLMAPFDRDRQGGVLVVIHDVTEQRKNEEMRREFVANVSHELRTPSPTSAAMLKRWWTAPETCPQPWRRSSWESSSTRATA